MYFVCNVKSKSKMRGRSNEILNQVSFDFWISILSELFHFIWFCIETWLCYGKAPVGRIFFTGEHTSERFSGYVHGGYLAGEQMMYLVFLRYKTIMPMSL